MKLVSRFADGKPVCGFEVVGEHIYIVRADTPHIEVYNKNNFGFERNIDIPGVKGPYDMVQSRGHPTFLLIADWSNPLTITAVQLPGDIVSTWTILEPSDVTLGLARSNVYTGANFVVIKFLSQIMTKLTPQENQINLQNIPQPLQSIQVTEDQNAICSGYGPPPALHQVCIENACGQVIGTYGGIREPGVDQLSTPARLEMITKDNCILVIQTGNNTVVLLNNDLKPVAYLPTDDIEGPYRLYLDEENNLLYVADNVENDERVDTSGRVLVYQLK